jgi:hypothetical protein
LETPTESVVAAYDRAWRDDQEPNSFAGASRMSDITASAVAQLLVLALPVAAITWTVTHEELFRELHDYFVERSTAAASMASRKFFYLLTCEYCFSHYVSAGAIALTGFAILFDDWRGYLIAWLSLVWVANHYISLYGRLRLGIRSERLEIGLKEAVSERAGVAKINRPRGRDRRAG